MRQIFYLPLTLGECSFVNLDQYHQNDHAASFSAENHGYAGKHKCMKSTFPLRNIARKNKMAKEGQIEEGERKRADEK